MKQNPLSSSGLSPDGQFKLTSLIIPIYLPSLIIFLGWGMIIPIIPLFAKKLGAGLGLASIVVSIHGFGILLADIPGGAFLNRFGEKPTAILAISGTALSAFFIGLFRELAVLILMVFIFGAFRALFFLSIQTYVKRKAPVHMRGRSLALIGGMMRIGMFLGPIAGGFIGKILGMHTVFLSMAFLTLISFGIVLFIRSGASVQIAENASTEKNFARRLWLVLKENRSAFVRTGIPVIILQILRTARLILFPLWGEAIGLDVAQIGLIVGISSAIDLIVFYPMGSIMDRFGRKWTAVPCISLLSLGILLIPLAGNFIELLLVGIIAGIGNGFGSGIVLTLGADLAPDKDTGHFLGLWRLICDIGTSGGPGIVGGVSEFLGLAAAPVSIAVPGFLGALMMAIWARETLIRKVPD